MALLAQVDISQNFTPATTFKTVGDLVNVLVKNFFVVTMIILFAILIFAGLQFMLNSGDEKKAEQSKSAITAVIIGILVLFGAYWIVQIIEFITGVSILNSGI